MSVYRNMLNEDHRGLLNDKEETLIDMKFTLNQMMSEMDDIKILLNKYTDDPSQLPVNHHLSLKTNPLFVKLFRRYHELVEDLI